MEKNEIIVALEPVIESFNELGISYYIGGSLASSAFGIPRSTLDVDLISSMAPHQINPLVEKLKNDYFIDAEMIKDALVNKSSFNILHLKSMVKIDVFILKDHQYHHKSFERKVKEKLTNAPNSLSVFLCSPEDLILNKLEWFRLGGGISERQWLDVLGIIKVQNDSLDKEYLLKWAEELGIIDLLKKAFSEIDFGLS